MHQSVKKIKNQQFISALAFQKGIRMSPLELSAARLTLGKTLEKWASWTFKYTIHKYIWISGEILRWTKNKKTKKNN